MVAPAMQRGGHRATPCMCLCVRVRAAAARAAAAAAAAAAGGAVQVVPTGLAAVARALGDPAGWPEAGEFWMLLAAQSMALGTIMIRSVGRSARFFVACAARAP